jgi:co-chaperonin GroES (HSP10)
MKAVRYLIIESEQDYNNEVELAGTKIVVNSTIESVENINRIGTVVSSPEGTILESGDKVIVHHNIMRRKNDTKGDEIRSPFHIEDGKYFVPLDQVFAYKREGDKDWNAIDPYCFIKPIQIESKQVGSIHIPVDAQENFKGRENGVGVIRYINRQLGEQEGLKVGDKIHFEPWSEHEFEIDGELLYKMRTSDIQAKAL